MKTETLRAIAKLAEDKRVRIELLPLGFGITARAVIRGKGMVQVKQTIAFADVEDSMTQLELFEAVIDAATVKLKDPPE